MVVKDCTSDVDDDRSVVKLLAEVVVLAKDCTSDVDDDMSVVKLLAEVVEAASVRVEKTDASTHPNWQPLLKRQLFQKVSLDWLLSCLSRGRFGRGKSHRCATRT